MNFALRLDPAFSMESGSRLFAEAQEAGVDFAVCNWRLKVTTATDVIVISYILKAN